MNLKEQIHARIIPILEMRGFSNRDRCIALESIYDDFEKQGYDTKVIGALIADSILDEMRKSNEALNLVLEHFRKRRL